MTIIRASISALPRGHQFSPVTFRLSREDVSSYLRSTGDTGNYGDSVPPLAAVALGLQALQEQLSLPQGALHTGQEVEHLGAVSVHAQLEMHGSVAQRSERQGFVISVIEFAITEAGRDMLRARTTIMAPGGGV